MKTVVKDKVSIMNVPFLLGYVSVHMLIFISLVSFINLTSLFISIEAETFNLLGESGNTKENIKPIRDRSRPTTHLRSKVCIFFLCLYCAVYGQNPPFCVIFYMKGKKT